jgi:N-acetylmuramoyl-L-alanine amidase
MCILLISIISYEALDQAAVNTIALPTTNKVVIIDAGHGGIDPGASSPSGVSEKNINLGIALKLQALIEQSGGIAVLTRAEDESIHDDNNKTVRQKKISDLLKRQEIARTSYGDIFISLHLNSFPDPRYGGWQTFYSEKNEHSKRLAELIQSGIKFCVEKDNKREAHPIKDIIVLKDVDIPAVVVECGFLSNEQDEKLLVTNEYQDKLAWGIYTGITNYLYEQNISKDKAK